jgi:hypothetical protein
MEQFGLRRQLGRNEIVRPASDAWLPMPVVDSRQWTVALPSGKDCRLSFRGSKMVEPF